MPAADLAKNKGGDYLGGRYYPGKVCGSRRHRLPGIYFPRTMMLYVLQFDAISATPSGVSTMDRRPVAYRTRQILTGISNIHRRLEGERMTVDIFPGSQLPVRDRTNTLYCLPSCRVLQRCTAATILTNYNHHGR